MAVAMAAQLSKFDEHVLVEQTDRYSCPKCKLLLRDAVQPSCGHRLCQECVDELIKNGPTKCPVLECDLMIQQEHSSDHFPDLYFRREILRLEAICPCKPKGCSWRGQFRSLEEHVRVCNFKAVVCQYCGATVYEGHVSVCSLQHEYCGKSVTMLEVDQHKDICQYPLLESHSQEYESPVHSSESSSVQSFNQGLMTVQLSVYPFPDYYLSSGSSSLPVIDIHSDQLHHMIPCTNQIHESSAELSAASSTPRQHHAVFDCNSRPVRVASPVSSNAGSGFTWKIDRFCERMKEAQSGKFMTTNSPVFYSSPQGYKMFLRVYLNGDGHGMDSHVSIFLVIMKGEFDSVLQWPFKHKVTIRLINHKPGAKDIVEVLCPNRRRSFKKPRSVMNIGCGCPRFISHHELHAHGFIADDTIIIRCQVDSSFVCTP